MFHCEMLYELTLGLPHLAYVKTLYYIHVSLKVAEPVDNFK